MRTPTEKKLRRKELLRLKSDNMWEAVVLEKGMQPNRLCYDTVKSINRLG